MCSVNQSTVYSHYNILIQFPIVSKALRLVKAVPGEGIHGDDIRKVDGAGGPDCSVHFVPPLECSNTPMTRDHLHVDGMRSEHQMSSFEARCSCLAAALLSQVDIDTAVAHFSLRVWWQYIPGCQHPREMEQLESTPIFGDIVIIPLRKLHGSKTRVFVVTQFVSVTITECS